MEAIHSSTSESVGLGSTFSSSPDEKVIMSPMSSDITCPDEENQRSGIDIDDPEPIEQYSDVTSIPDEVLEPHYDTSIPNDMIDQDSDGFLQSIQSSGTQPDDSSRAFKETHEEKKLVNMGELVKIITKTDPGECSTTWNIVQEMKMLNCSSWLEMSPWNSSVTDANLKQELTGQIKEFMQKLSGGNVTGMLSYVLTNDEKWGLQAIKQECLESPPSPSLLDNHDLDGGQSIRRRVEDNDEVQTQVGSPTDDEVQTQMWTLNPDSIPQSPSCTVIKMTHPGSGSKRKQESCANFQPAADAIKKRLCFDETPNATVPLAIEQVIIKADPDSITIVEQRKAVEKEPLDITKQGKEAEKESNKKPSISGARGPKKQLISKLKDILEYSDEDLTDEDILGKFVFQHTLFNQSGFENGCVCKRLATSGQLLQHLWQMQGPNQMVQVCPACFNFFLSSAKSRQDQRKHAFLSMIYQMHFHGTMANFLRHSGPSRLVFELAGKSKWMKHLKCINNQESYYFSKCNQLKVTSNGTVTVDLLPAFKYIQKLKSQIYSPGDKFRIFIVATLGYDNNLLLNLRSAEANSAPNTSSKCLQTSIHDFY